MVTEKALKHLSPREQEMMLDSSKILFKNSLNPPTPSMIDSCLLANKCEEKLNFDNESLITPVVTALMQEEKVLSAIEEPKIETMPLSTEQVEDEDGEEPTALTSEKKKKKKNKNKKAKATQQEKMLPEEPILDENFPLLYPTKGAKLQRQQDNSVIVNLGSWAEGSS